jgi:predicted transposase/invertase (TIGR01784 family)
VIVQDSERNIYGRSVRLDALGILGTGERINIEIQRSDDDNHLKRARFNAASITVKDSNPGDRFENVVDVCIVYISQFDLFKRNKTLYHVDKILRETGEKVDDGLREVFVNTKINDGSTVAELMECFLQKEVDNSKFPKLSNRMKTLKSTESGVRAVCEIMQKYQKITAIQTTVENYFELGASKEKAIESLMRKYGLSEQEALESYEKYSPAPVASV